MKIIQHSAILLAVTVAFAGGSMAHATEQMPYTFIVNTNGTWILHSNYLDGDCIVIDNEVTGKKTVLSVRDLLPEKDIAMTTAGDEWSDRLLWDLFSVGSTNLFAARSASGARFVINLDTALKVDPKPFSKMLRKRDRETVLVALKTAKGVLFSDMTYKYQSDRIVSAVHHAGLLLEEKARLDLQKLAQMGDGKYVVIKRVRALAKETLDLLDQEARRKGSSNKAIQANDASAP
jgi:hypothetical protein